MSIQDQSLYFQLLNLGYQSRDSLSGRKIHRSAYVHLKSRPH